MTFQFISGDIGPNERRLIRAHVMVGRNAGRPRPSYKRQRVATLQQGKARRETTQTNEVETDRDTSSVASSPALFDRLVSNDFAFTQLSQQSEHSVELLRDCTETIPMS